MAFTTRKTLLVRVRNGDEVSWAEFYDTYQPLIWLCGSDHNLNHEEKQELVQTVMIQIFKRDILENYDFDKVPSNITFKYEPSRGRFRHFLKKIIRNNAKRIFTKRREHLELEKQPALCDKSSFDKSWKREWMQHVMASAMVELRNRVSAETFLAFEKYAIHNERVRDVAMLLEISVSSVYTAKSRCIAVIKSIVKQLEDS
jgi:RNA polymerase sigma factor (sigma-70 family)